MDRISALRNIEEALATFEDGQCSLSELETDVRGILRTYAADFEGELQAYRAHTSGSADGIVVLASSEPEARNRVEELVDEPGSISVSPVER
jgi:hypothetical protein